MKTKYRCTPDNQSHRRYAQSREKMRPKIDERCRSPSFRPLCFRKKTLTQVKYVRCKTEVWKWIQVYIVGRDVRWTYGVLSVGEVLVLHQEFLSQFGSVSS
jgi:hypothetical protein